MAFIKVIIGRYDLLAGSELKVDASVKKPVHSSKDVMAWFDWMVCESSKKKGLSKWLEYTKVVKISTKIVNVVTDDLCLFYRRILVVNQEDAVQNLLLVV